MELCRPCSVRIPRIHGEQYQEQEYSQYYKEQDDIETTTRGHHQQHRLRAKENGMVMLPRSFYNSHPAASHLGTRNKGKRYTHTYTSPSSSPDTGTISSTRPHRNTANKKYAHKTASAASKTKTSATPGRKSSHRVKEYRLMFIEPEEVIVADTGDSPSADEPGKLPSGSLAKLVTEENLPSSKWKIEKIYYENSERGDQPLDALDAEMEALMGGGDGPKLDEKIEEPKQAEEFPSIMDILNEPAESLEEAAGNVDRQKKRSDDDLKSVLFQRVADDESTVDRTVTFQRNLEYAVTIGDRKVELLGAPGLITSDEDLKILLQIVDDLDPDCGCLDVCDS